MAVQQVRLTTSESRKIDLHWKPGAIFSALLASVVVQMFRMDQHRMVSAIWIECAIFLALPVIFFLLVTRWANRNEKSIKQSSITHLAQGGAAAIAVLLVLVQFFNRSIGLGDANEIVALLVVQAVSWHLAVFASVRGFERASLMLCGALIFFVCCMTSRMDILVVGSLFAISSLWWLVGLYWSRLDSKAIDGNPKVLAIHASATGITTVVIVITTVVIPVADAWIAKTFGFPSMALESSRDQ